MPVALTLPAKRFGERSSRSAGSFAICSMQYWDEIEFNAVRAELDVIVEQEKVSLRVNP